MENGIFKESRFELRIPKINSVVKLRIPKVGISVELRGPKVGVSVELRAEVGISIKHGSIERSIIIKLRGESGGFVEARRTEVGISFELRRRYVSISVKIWVKIRRHEIGIPIKHGSIEQSISTIELR